MRRNSFHDEIIHEVQDLNNRVLIRMAEFTFIITGSTLGKRWELPAIWFYDKFNETPGSIHLDLETDRGHLTLSGHDLRLIRNRDLAMLIPPIDA